MKTIKIVSVVLMAPLALWLSSANAEVSLLKPSNVAGPYSAYFPAAQTGFAITSGSTVGTGNGISLTTSGVATAVKNGTKFNIPVSLTTNISKAHVAKAAVGAFKIAKGLAGPVGMVLTAFEIYNLIKDSGLTPCAAPDFFCSTGAGTVVDPSSGSFYVIGAVGQFRTPTAACEYALSLNPGWGTGMQMFTDTAGNAWCGTKVPLQDRAQVVNFQVVCPSGATLSSTRGCVSDSSGASAPASDADIEAKLNASLANATTGAATAKRAWDAAQAVNAVARANGKPPVSADVMVPPTSQTTMTAPPVTTPQVTTSTQQYTDANGVPQTRTSQESSTITPVQSGNGSATSISYNVRNVTTTTVTNNTGQSTSNPPSTSTTTENTGLSIPSDSAIDLPTDYNREVTQQAIAADIKAMRNACQDNPRRAGCAEFDVPPVAEAIPRKEVPINYTPTIFASSATCPAPISFDMYGARQIAFTPMCDLMTKLRPLFLACAAAGAALIFMRGLKS
ncbi:virulence factor TspB C-terminal domain-related protein [Janthinobacterium sp. LB3P118]|uniref:virulence factor TspB C-terminal domain-related protein n=1 Tax=Janthinobacterium sp. LB3P118 TaxID=3424195 RepID=UPI003F23DACA